MTFYTQKQLDIINANRRADPATFYYQDNGFIWKGNNTKTLTLVSGPAPLPVGASTEITLIERTTPDDTQPISVIDLPLPIGAATEEKQDLLLNIQDDILEELKIKTTKENQEINNLDNYTIISLLSNILKELREQTKYLIKIYQ